jgi:hypothetical protein
MFMWDHTPGIFAAYSTNSGAANSWVGRVLATGGPTETNQAERSLPAAYVDPQATFDEYGNLFLTYLSGPIQQFGTATGGGGNTLADTSRNWATNMWAGRFVSAFVPGQNRQDRIIQGNTADTLTVTQAWTQQPNANTTYVISTAGFDANNNLLPGNAVVVVSSTNGGESFSFRAILDSGAGAAIDYPTIATGPGRNANERSVWVAWRAGNGNVMAAGAPVAGAGQFQAFNASQVVNGSNGMALPRAQVGPNGQVMVSFHTVGTPGPGATTTVYVNVDDDGLGNNGFRANATPVANPTIVMNGPGVATIPAQPNRGISPGVSLAWDWSGQHRPAPHGRVYLVYTTSFPGPNSPDTDIFIRYSDDSGVTWSLPTLVHDANANSQFMPSIAVDQTNGDLAVVWLDARNDVNNVQVELHGTVSVDGGASYEPFVRIAAGRSDARDANRQQRGTVTGGGNNTLTDNNQNWVPNNYWRNNYGARLRPGGANEETRPIIQSTATVLTVNANWTNNPQVGETYQILPITGRNPQGNPVSYGSIYSFDYGDYTGLAFHNGAFYPIWADNSNSTNDNPNGANRALDLYTSQVLVLEIIFDGGTATATSGTTTSSGTATIHLGTRSFSSVPNSNLLQAVLILAAQRTFPVQPPTGPSYNQFVQQMYGRVLRLEDLRASSPSSPAALLLGGQQPRPVPSLQDIDRFFQAAWADGVLNRDDVLRLLG